MWINAEITEKRREAGEEETEQGFRKGSEPGSTDLYLSLEEPESVIWELSQSCNCPSGKFFNGALAETVHIRGLYLSPASSICPMGSLVRMEALLWGRHGDQARGPASVYTLSGGCLAGRSRDPSALGCTDLLHSASTVLTRAALVPQKSKQLLVLLCHWRWIFHR